MLKRKTIAINVANLSDARYFAAYEVDFMAYFVALDGSNLGQIKEIIDWVAGPIPLIQVAEWNKDLIEFAFKTTEAQGIVLPYKSIGEVDDSIQNIWSLHHPSDLLPTSENVTPIVEITKPNDLPQLERVYIMPGNISVDDFEKALEKSPSSGVVLTGGEEEKVGLKSFEAQDELIDLLLEED